MKLTLKKIKKNRETITQRKRRKDGPKFAEGSEDKQNIAQALPISYKREAILDWSLNSGIIRGKRVTKAELAQELGLKVSEISSEINKIQAMRAQSFEKRDVARIQILSVVDRLMHQLELDRSRAIMHADILELELEKTRIKLSELQNLPELTGSQRNQKRMEIGRYLNHFRELSRDKIESIRALFESTDAITRFLTLFTGGKAGSKGAESGGLRSVLDSPPQDQQSEYLNYKKAIMLLEDGQTQILPAQPVGMNNGPRNPNAGFEEFKDPESDE